ncbi:MAG: DUF948 domain-containing protein [Smithellaceae bacterium]
MYLEIGVVLIGAALCILVLFCIPILVKLWRAINNIAITLDVLNQRLPAILDNVEGISTHVNESTKALNLEVQKYAETADRIHHVLSNVVSGVEWLSPIASRSPLLRKVTEATALVKGIRAFIMTLKEKKKVIPD